MPMNVTAVAAVSVIGALMVRPEGLVIKLYRMIVPAALLELDDRNAVIKAQVGTALPLLAINTLLIWGLAF